MSIALLFTASLTAHCGVYSVFGGDWTLPPTCEVHILGSLNSDAVQAWCPLNEEDIERADFVSISFKKKDSESLELLESLAREDTLVRESAGALTITTWQKDLVKSRHLLSPDADPEVIERLKSKKGFYRVICDQEVCIHMDALHLESIESLSRKNLESHNKSLKRTP